MITVEMRKRLPIGYAKLIATQCNCSPNTVYHTAHNRTKNEIILLELLRMIKAGRERKREISELMQAA